MKKSALILSAMILILALGRPAHSAARSAALLPPYSIIVNSLSDYGEGDCDDGICTLREAITEANSAGLSAQISFSVSGTIFLAATLPQVTTSYGMTITGPITISGGNSFQIMTVHNPGQLALHSIKFIDAYTNNFGGAINNNAGSVTIDSCTFYDNHASLGGAIYNTSTVAYVTATLIIDRSTFDSNGAWAVNNIGGAIYNGGGVTHVTNSTIVYNSADNGAAIANGEGWAVFIESSTFAGNNVTAPGGASLLNSSGGISIRNSIIGYTLGDGINCSGSISNSGNNIDSGASCGFGSDLDSHSSTDPHLGGLDNYGGPTQSMRIVAPSLAIDGVTNDPLNCSLTDQRGQIRPFDGDGDGVAFCDIGAYEIEPRLYLPLVMR